VAPCIISLCGIPYRRLVICMRRMAILSPAAPGAHFCIVWYCFTAEIAFLHNAASAQGGDSRLTAEFSRRRLAPRAAMREQRQPHAKD